MFDLGFTMEELMFPENYQYSCLFNIESNRLLDKSDELSTTYDYREQMIEDDDWFTIKQLSSDNSATDNYVSFINDQTLPLSNVFSENCYLGQVKSSDEMDGTITTALLLPNLAIKVVRDKNINSLSSDTVPTISSSPPCDKRSLTTTSITQKQQSNIYSMSKSTSSLSFCTQASVSTTSSSDEGMSPNSKDLNEITTIRYSAEPVQKLPHHHHHHKNNNSTNDDLLNIINRRRRKRTIFSAADIEHLKEAFIQNPKPSQQDIAILSDQLGHDSYVIRVWFYNKRQATKKRNE